MKSPFFEPEEFQCNCEYVACIDSYQYMSESFLQLLFKVRAQIDFPLVVTSGYRCKRHNKDVGGVPNSAHTRGYAVDVRITSPLERYELIEQLVYHGLSFGVYSNFVHIELKRGDPQCFYGK